MTLSLPWPFGGSADSVPLGDDGVKTADEGAEHKPMISLLEHYDGTATSLPPSARVDPALRQRERQPLGFFDLWKYGKLVATKATELATDVVSHHLWGPRRKSWGIEMTIITSFMRNASQHSQLADINMLRRLIALAGYVPFSSDALVTPVTFRVKARRLRGLLSDVAAAETGKRELAGEWVVGKRLWKRLQAEWRAAQKYGGASSSPSRPKRKDLVTLFLHGGAYYMFSAATHRLLTIQLSKYIDTRIFALDYRLAPETRFPGQLHDAVCAYFRLIEDLHIPPENIIIAGDSAGGGLSLALLMYLRDNNYPLPSGAILFSPWVDLTMSCDSWDSNAAYDVVPMPTPGDHLNPVACYLGPEGMKRYLSHPYASPLFGDFKGLPPMLIQAGDSEVLRDEITLLAHKATMAGVSVRHELYEDAVHVFQTFSFTDVARKAYLSCRDFVKIELPMHRLRSPRVLGSAAEDELEHEIDSRRSRIVRGDGVEVDTGSDGAEVLDESESSGSDSKEDITREEPSWVRRSSLPAHTNVHSVEDHGGDEDEPLAPPKSPFMRYFTGVPSFTPAQAEAAADHDFNPSHPPSPIVPTVQTPASSPKRQRNHNRHQSGGGHRASGLSTLSITSSITNAPPPSIRSSHRAISHPDISSLCEEWAHSGPANRTTKYSLPHVPQPGY